jgi:hypothetical protein
MSGRAEAATSERLEKDNDKYEIGQRQQANNRETGLRQRKVNNEKTMKTATHRRAHQKQIK